ncbi:hypothetical protein ISF_02268 [Cordyceps fumosorosea ARSEF 2679]|uniref:TNT domain-containing protein n=1 Tax=Cordyceps fumosorosea (strain ARSEF 2679) TaxID=1081104 RepID=A0A162LGJ7_CORFA|nr:hypothetical protein ISF_02268 [Cordyceps fumosorosea ARSEF 2679]OAA70294.1 hypothetical protein ISF_02268 [Cordyceps fumosorosea ARSEF 2679]
MKFLATLVLPYLAGAAAINGRADATGPCSCKGATPGTDADAAATYLCADARLGPKQLPTKLPLGRLVSGYNRLGRDDVTVEQFLANWTGPDGKYKYPPQNGFTLDDNGNAINGTMQLEVGTLIDRFGSERGQYVTAASAPYSQRSLPPSSLKTDPRNPDFPNGYHLYKVIRPFTVVGGPIAPWFGQPGLGAQFWTGKVGTILQLITDGYIERQDPSILLKQSSACTVGTGA